MSSIGVFIYLKKAFDALNNGILVKKLEHYGIRGIASKWIISYLAIRKQYTNIQNTSSEHKEILCGVPHGSIPGPKLLIIYINEICNISPTLKFTLFADDTNIFYSGNNINNMYKSISRELNIVNEWFCVNKLSLNFEKHISFYLQIVDQSNIL